MVFCLPVLTVATVHTFILPIFYHADFQKSGVLHKLSLLLTILLLVIGKKRPVSQEKRV